MRDTTTPISIYPPGDWPNQHKMAQLSKITPSLVQTKLPTTSKTRSTSVWDSRPIWHWNIRFGRRYGPSRYNNIQAWCLPNAVCVSAGLETYSKTRTESACTTEAKSSLIPVMKVQKYLCPETLIIPYQHLSCLAATPKEHCRVEISLALFSPGLLTDLCTVPPSSLNQLCLPSSLLIITGLWFCDTTAIPAKPR